MTTLSPTLRRDKLTRSQQVGAAGAEGTQCHFWGVLSLHSAHSSTKWWLGTFGFLVTQKTPHIGKKPIFLLGLLQGREVCGCLDGRYQALFGIERVKGPRHPPVLV